MGKPYSCQGCGVAHIDKLLLPILGYGGKWNCETPSRVGLKEHEGPDTLNIIKLE